MSDSSSAILFLCYGNSVRSQMAEALAERRFPDVRIESAGVVASSLDPIAVEVMSEVGIDIANRRSKCIEELTLEEFSLIISCAGDAVLPPLDHQAQTIVWNLPNPGACGVDREGQRKLYRVIRDQLSTLIEGLSL